MAQRGGEDAGSIRPGASRPRLLALLTLVAGVALAPSGVAAPVAAGAAKAPVTTVVPKPGTVAAPAPTHVMQSGETLGSVASAVYGSPHYRLAIEKLNKLAPGSEPPAGAAVLVPDLKRMLFAEGFPKELADEVSRLATARYQYMRVRNELVRSLEFPDAKLPTHAVKELRAAADEIEAVGAALAKKGKYAESPLRMKQRLQECAKALRRLAGGTRDKKVEDSVHLLLAQTWVRGIMWARGEGA
jgi:hypothetical protein